MPLRRPQATLAGTRLQQRNQFWALAALLLADRADDTDLSLACVLIQIGMETTRSGRFGPRGPYEAAQSVDMFHIILQKFTDRRFRAWFRVSREAFWYLHSIIKDDPVFLSTGKRPQRPVYYQLASFLCRYGNTAAIKTSSVITVAEGTVYNYCERVRDAIRSQMRHFVKWPDTGRRLELSQSFEVYGFPGCLGIIDGSLIPLVDKPVVDGPIYWSRKHMYALNIQAICDDEGRFIDWVIGWPGSVHDSRVFTNSHFWRHRERYLEPGEYILADKGYALTPFTIRPFNDNDLNRSGDKKAERKAWNYALSRIRIEVEHAFGRLKGRFRVLQNFPGRNMPNILLTIEALMIIHNMLHDFGDRGDDMMVQDQAEADDEAEDDNRRLGRWNEDKLYIGGVLRRKELVQYAINQSII